MDIKEKLSYYKSKSSQKVTQPESHIPASIKALAKEYKAEICEPGAPYLKISRTIEINADLLSNINHPLYIN
ncbi:MAG TPA: hypothetical protein ENO18_00940, partial [Caldithrix sp.]|nr:hypothetical protein [Caldithrix sp.]